MAIPDANVKWVAILIAIYVPIIFMIIPRNIRAASDGTNCVRKTLGPLVVPAIVIFLAAFLLADEQERQLREHKKLDNVKSMMYILLTLIVMFVLFRLAGDSTKLTFEYLSYVFIGLVLSMVVYNIF
jgi:hypothetical protein